MPILRQGLGHWALGVVVAGAWLGAAQAGPLPLAKAPASGLSSIQTVQSYYGDEDDDWAPPPRRYYAPPAYGYYGPPRGYYGRQYRYEGPREAYGYDPYGRSRGAYRSEPQFYTKDQVRAWNRMHGF